LECKPEILSVFFASVVRSGKARQDPFVVFPD
jgi:hypothetical protein